MRLIVVFHKTINIIRDASRKNVCKQKQVKLGMTDNFASKISLNLSWYASQRTPVIVHDGVESVCNGEDGTVREL